MFVDRAEAFRNEMLGLVKRNFQSDSASGEAGMDVELTNKYTVDDMTVVIPEDAKDVRIANNVFGGNITIFIKKCLGEIVIECNEFRSLVVIEVSKSSQFISIESNVFHLPASISLPQYLTTDFDKNIFSSSKIIKILRNRLTDAEIDGSFISENKFRQHVEILNLSCEITEVMKLAYEDPSTDGWLDDPFNHPVMNALREHITPGVNDTSNYTPVQFKSADNATITPINAPITATEKEVKPDDPVFHFVIKTSFPYVDFKMPFLSKLVKMGELSESDDEECSRVPKIQKRAKFL